MRSHRLYLKLAGSIFLIVLLAYCSALLLITGNSYTLSFISLLFILLITLLINRWINKANHQIESFFNTLKNHDYSLHFQEKQKDLFLSGLYKEMNNIITIIGDIRQTTEEKQLYYESILRVLTHEIRNSITPISSLSADLLKYYDSYEPAELKNGLEVINNQAQDISAFLDSYYQLTHLPQPEKKQINIQILLKKLERLFHAEPDNEKIQYICDKPVFLQIDSHLITLALINLIRNALQAISNRENGFISVEVKETKKHIHIIIADNGPGIPQELLSAIFTPFFSTKPKGSGIGLSISQRIMQLHNGLLTVNSLPNIRTTFTLQFQSEA